MPGYRLYFLDPNKGRFQKACELHSADDVGAICLAQEHIGSSILELWRGDTMVTRIGAIPKPARPSQPAEPSPTTDGFEALHQT